MALDFKQLSQADRDFLIAQDLVQEAAKQASYIGQTRAEQMHNEIVRAQVLTGRTFYSDRGQAGAVSKYTNDDPKDPQDSAPVAGSAEWWAAQVAGREAAAVANTQYTPVSQSTPEYSAYVAPPASTVAAANLTAQSAQDYISSLPTPFISRAQATPQSDADYIASLPTPFMSSNSVAQPYGTSQFISPVQNGVVSRVYMPEGRYAQQEFSDVKTGFASEDGKSTGEFALYTKLPGGRTTIDPNTGKQSQYILRGGGSRNFLQSGTGGFAAATPLVYAEGGVGTGTYKMADVYAPGVLKSGVSADYLKSMITDLNAEKMSIFDVPVSRLGSEAYGGIVQPLDGRTLGDITYEDVSNRASWNLASYVNPTDVNLSKSKLPGVNIPWSVSDTAPAIFAMTTKGGVGKEILAKPFYADVITDYKPNVVPQSGSVKSIVAESPSVSAPASALPAPFISVGKSAPVTTTSENWLAKIPTPLKMGAAVGMTAFAPGFGSSAAFAIPAASAPLFGGIIGTVGVVKLEQAGLLGLTAPTEGFSVRTAGEKVGAYVYKAGQDYGTAWNKRIALDASIEYQKSTMPYEDKPIFRAPGGFSLPKISDAPDMPVFSTPGRGSEQVLNAPGLGFAGIVGLPGAVIGGALLKTSSAISSPQSNIFPDFMPRVIEYPQSQIIPTPATKTSGGSIARSIDTGRNLYDLTAAPTAAVTATKAKSTNTYADMLSSSYFDATAKSNEFAFARPGATTTTRNPSLTTASSPFASPQSDALAFASPAATTTTLIRPATTTPKVTITTPFTTDIAPRSRPDKKQEIRSIKLPGLNLPSFGGGTGSTQPGGRGKIHREILEYNFGFISDPRGLKIKGSQTIGSLGKKKIFGEGYESLLKTNTPVVKPRVRTSAAPIKTKSSQNEGFALNNIKSISLPSSFPVKKKRK